MRRRPRWRSASIAGLYVRGLVFEYRATWESTFLDAPTVRAILAAAYWPGARVLGLAVPDAAQIAAIRAPASENAALWLHLMSATLAAVVIVPRAGARRRRRAGRAPSRRASLRRSRRSVLRAAAARLSSRDRAGARRAVQLHGGARRAREPGSAARARARRQRRACRRRARRVRRRGRGGARTRCRCARAGDRALQRDGHAGTGSARPLPRGARRARAAAGRRRRRGRVQRALAGRCRQARRAPRAVEATRRRASGSRPCSSTWRRPTRTPPRRRSKRPSTERRHDGRSARRDLVSDPGATIALSLISHTNAGKTTLARTLLARDVGEVRDAPHVTTEATAYPLIETRPRRRAGALGHARLRRQRAPGAPARAGRQPDRLVPDAGVGPLARPAVLAHAARGAQRARPRGRDPLPRQRGGEPRRRRLPRARTRGARVDGQARAGAAQPDGAAARARRGGAGRRALARRARRRTRTCATCLRSTRSRAAGCRSSRCSRRSSRVLPPDRRPPFARLAAAWRARRWAQFDAAIAALAQPVAAAICARVVVPPKPMLRRLGTALGVGGDAADDDDAPRAARARRTARRRHARARWSA